MKKLAVMPAFLVKKNIGSQVVNNFFEAVASL